MKHRVYLYAFLLVWGFGMPACSAQELLNENESTHEIPQKKASLQRG